MNIQRNIGDDQVATLTVEVPTDQTSQKFVEALQGLQRRANIPGFRPGKAPLSLIRSRYGRDLFEETAEKLATGYVETAIKQEGLKPGGRITLNLLEFGDTKPLRFEISFPLKPEIKLTKYTDLEVLINDADITDEDVQMQLEGLRRKHAVPVPIDGPATADCLMKIKYRDADPSGLPLVGRTTNEMSFEFGSDMLGIGTDEQLLGIKIGETRLIRTRRNDNLASPDQHHILSPQEYSHPERGGREQFVAVEVERIEKPEIPELDDAFAKKVNEKLNSADELKRWMRTNLMSFVAAGASRQIERSVIHRMIEENPFTISDRIVHDTLHDVGEDMKLDHDGVHKFIDEHFAEAERDLRWVMLRDAVAEAEGINVTDEMVHEELNRLAEMTGEPLEKIRERYTSANTLERLRNHMFERHVVDFLVRHAKVERRMMSFSEFIRSGKTEDME